MCLVVKNSRISRQSAHEGSKVVSSKHRPSLPPEECYIIINNDNDNNNNISKLVFINVMELLLLLLLLLFLNTFCWIQV